MTMTEAEAREMGRLDAKDMNSPCPPVGPWYFAYLDAYMDEKEARR